MPTPAASLYETDEFRMFSFKVLPCTKRGGHDWTECVFAHPGEKATRRCPKTYAYSAVACPDVRKSGRCPRGDSCCYAHSVFEFWLHPARYRTQLCSFGAKCKRSVCFFAHSVQELRMPTMSGTKDAPMARPDPASLICSPEMLNPFASMAPVALPPLHSAASPVHQTCSPMGSSSSPVRQPSSMQLLLQQPPPLRLQQQLEAPWVQEQQLQQHQHVAAPQPGLSGEQPWLQGPSSPWAGCAGLLSPGDAGALQTSASLVSPTLSLPAHLAPLQPPKEQHSMQPAESLLQHVVDMVLQEQQRRQQQQEELQLRNFMSADVQATQQAQVLLGPIDKLVPAPAAAARGNHVPSSGPGSHLPALLQQAQLQLQFCQGLQLEDPTPVPPSPAPLFLHTLPVAQQLAALQV